MSYINGRRIKDTIPKTNWKYKYEDAQSTIESLQAERDAWKAKYENEHSCHTMDLASCNTEIAVLKAKAEKLAEVLKQIKSVLGPLPTPSCCEGAQVEMEIAFNLAKAALEGEGK